MGLDNHSFCMMGLATVKSIGISAVAFACLALVACAEQASVVSAKAPAGRAAAAEYSPEEIRSLWAYWCASNPPHRTREWCRSGATQLGYLAANVSTPLLPWPPPRPSAFISLKDRIQTNGTFGDVAKRLAARLNDRGYENFLYYEVEGGFAVTTELERFDENGRATGGDKRFQRGKLGGYFGFTDLVHKIFVGEDGHFRVFIFIVTDKAFPIADDPAIEGDVERWGKRGSLYLPKAIAVQKTNTKTVATLLVYEFVEDRGKSTSLTATRRFVPAQAHLRWLGFSE